MAIHNLKRGERGRSQTQTAKHAHFVSPNGGIDTRIPISSDNQNVCLYAFNMVPSEYGLRIRNGYQEWQTGIDNGASTGIKTIIPFEGSTEGPAEDRLFAVNNEGIWDVSIQGATPILMIAFPDQSPEAGRGTYAHYIDAVPNEFIYYADNLNGLYEYNQTIDTWALADEVTGVDPQRINFVVVHKLRIWFGERDSTSGWYLDIGSRKGIATEFNFGAKFAHGGSMVGLFNWTVDGGKGVDDLLIAVSSSGDVLPYQGSDPSQADWALVGTYFIGSMADGARCASQFGGNVTLLSTYGLTQMSDLLRGVDPRLPNMDSIGSQVSAIVRTQMKQYRNEPGWDVRYLHAEGALCIATPPKLDGTYLQYVYNVTVGGWGMWRGVPMDCVDMWEDSIYFGTKDNRVMAMNVDKDNVLLDPPTETNGEYIEFSMLHAYTALSDPTVYKRGKLIRPDFMSTASLTYATKFLYDFDTTELVITPPSPTDQEDSWDVGEWDKAIWSAGEQQKFDRTFGGTGIGRYVSVAIKGQGLAGTTLASTDILWDQGWFL